MICKVLYYYLIENSFCIGKFSIDNKKKGKRSLNYFKSY